MNGGISTEWPLTGRDVELDLITTTLQRTRAVLLAGPAGVGKTRLARAALERGRPGRIHWVAASASAGQIPLGAFVPVLGPPQSDVAAVPGLLAHAYATLCARQRMVLGIDDAHLLDDVSATLLHQLAAERTATLVITLRAGHPAPDAVTTLWKDGLVARIDIEALAVGQTTDVLEAALGGPVVLQSARRLHQATSGNVLWLQHLVAGELTEKRLVQREGLWIWDGQPRLTPALADLIDARIGPLSDSVRPVVELVSVGQPLRLELLTSLTSSHGVDEALDRGLVELADDRQVRLAHPLYGEIIRARTGERRARRLRGELATALAESGADGPSDRLRRAVLSLDSALPTDPDLLTAAAGHAASRGAAGLALRLLRAACDSGGGFEAHLGCATVLMWMHRYEDAEEAFYSGAAYVGSSKQRDRLSSCRILNLHFGLARVEEAAAQLRAVVHPVPAVGLLGIQAFLDASMNRLAEAERGARAVFAEPEPGDQARFYAAYAMVIVAGFAGRAGELATFMDRGRTAALRALETAPFYVNLAHDEVYALFVLGRPAAIRASIDRFEAIFGDSYSMVRALRGMQSLAGGNVREAVRSLRDSRAFFVGHGAGFMTFHELLLACALAAAGDPAGARDAVDRATSCRHPGFTVTDPHLELARAWVAAAEGGITKAVETARTAADLAADSEQWAVEMLARHACVSFGDTTQAARLRELAGIVDGPRATLAADHAEGFAAADPDALLATSHAFEAAELVLPAAESAAHAAQICRRRGNTAKAGEAATRAARLADHCGARTPVLIAAAQPFPISDRQREIASLATRLTNKEIAEQLGVSVRTVEGHIYHACTRLGLPSRTALAEYVSRIH